MEHAWIVSREDEAQAVFASDALLVRPARERVPEAMRGTALGAVFERLARMNDGDRHAQLRSRLEERLARWRLTEIERIAREAADRAAPRDAAAYVMASLAGIADPLGAVAWIRDFAGAVAGGATPAAVERGIAATQPLLDALPPGADEDETANTLGLFFQAYAATARLIENLVNGRTDPPVALTRRYAARDVEICGAQLREGDAVVVLLAVPSLQYGAGRHACPGRAIAETIAHAVADALMKDADRISA